jgi:hypothetical protein
MVASPDICRKNGRKSKGAKTERGKAISSRNAAKHGLLAQKPPLLVSEDLATFEGMIQGLIDYYQPESPVEHFLIQQVAMGMLKQYRLWSVETAIVNIELLYRERARKFPDIVKPTKESLFSRFERSQDERIPLKTFLEREKQDLTALLDNLEGTIGALGETDAAIFWLDIQHLLEGERGWEGKAYFIDRHREALSQWLSFALDDASEISRANWEETIARIRGFLQLARQRIAEINLKLDDIQQYDDAIDREATTSLSIQDPELYARYQRNINRDLYAAIDRLNAIVQQR